MSTTSPFVVSAEWLESRLGEPGVIIVDGSWYLPAQNRDARAEYDAAHIPGAVFFDQDRVVAANGTLPHTFPSPQEFGQFASAMGVGTADTIVVYDGPGFFSAPRVWWMFRLMGAQNVFVLDGGFDQWKQQRRKVTDAPTRTAPTFFDVDYAEDRVATLDDMRVIVEKRSSQIADARSPGRFRGADPEPRAGVRSGHMPGANNLPATALSKDGKFLSVEELRSALEGAGIDLSKPVVTSCGSGVTAAVISLALASVGHTDNRLYDGSWTEWGGRDDTPAVMGDD